MALHTNDMIEVEIGGEKQILVVQKMTKGKITFRPHNLARTDEEYEGVGRLMKTESTIRELKPRLLDVTVLGDLRYRT